MNHLVLKCSTNDSSCPCIKCIKNEEAGGKLLNEVQVFHLMVKLLNIQVFTMKRGIGTATSESEGKLSEGKFSEEKNGIWCAACNFSYTVGKPDNLHASSERQKLFFFFCEI